MNDERAFSCKIFANDDQIYSGGFDEVPEQIRRKIARDLSEWSERLGKSGLNELFYSHLSWYEQTEAYCENCPDMNDGGAGTSCEQCGTKLKTRYTHDRNKKLDMIMTCIGMITRVEVETD